MSARPVQPVTESGADADGLELNEGALLNSISESNPLSRTATVCIRSTMKALANNAENAKWTPSETTLKNILQHEKFTSLSGASERQGCLKSLALHNLSVEHVHSTFPISLGATITGVDSRAYSSKGTPYSMVVLPHTSAPISRSLQKDDITHIYDFARRYPGYTAHNIGTQGVHPVDERGFVLVAHDHPVLQAIQENQHRFQNDGNVMQMMQEGLVKISKGVYDQVMPDITMQISNQIKMRDFSNASVSVEPADYTSWSEARNALILEKKRPLNAEKTAALAACAGEKERAGVMATYASKEAKIESEVDNTAQELHMNLKLDYNFLAK